MVSNNRTTIRRTRLKGRWSLLSWPIWLVILVVLVLGWLMWNWSTISAQARLGTAYGARVACSCKYVGGRAIEDCDQDFEPGMGLVSLSLDEDARAVTASVPLVASATARYKEGWGCLLDPVK